LGRSRSVIVELWQRGVGWELKEEGKRERASWQV
jgi:hypothetical protein